MVTEDVEYVAPYPLLSSLNLLCDYGVFRRLIVRALELPWECMQAFDEPFGEPTAAKMEVSPRVPKHQFFCVHSPQPICMLAMYTHAITMQFEFQKHI